MAQNFQKYFKKLKSEQLDRPQEFFNVISDFFANK